jgi:chromosome condensin MukBEF ATPase and DNA-binding subunit MukB
MKRKDILRDIEQQIKADEQGAALRAELQDLGRQVSEDLHDFERALHDFKKQVAEAFGGVYERSYKQ